MCGFRYGLTGPVYGQYRAVPASHADGGTKQWQGAPDPTIPCTGHQPHSVLQMVAGGPSAGGEGDGGGAGAKFWAVAGDTSARTTSRAIAVGRIGLL